MDNDALLTFIRNYKGRRAIEIDDRNAELRDALIALFVKQPELAPRELLSDLVRVQSRSLTVLEVHNSNFVDVLSHSMEEDPLGGVLALCRCAMANSQDVDGTLHGRLRISADAMTEATQLLEQLLAARKQSPYWTTIYETVRDDYLAYARERDSKQTKES